MLAEAGAKKEPRLKHLLFVGVGHDFIYPMSISIKFVHGCVVKKKGQGAKNNCYRRTFLQIEWKALFGS